MKAKDKLFDSPNIRCIWDEKSREWYYSIMDVVAALTKSTDPQRQVERIKSDSAYIRRNWKYMAKPMVVPDKNGDKRRIVMANATSILRIVLCIHTPLAEPYKWWACMAACEQLNAEAHGQPTTDALATDKIAADIIAARTVPTPPRDPAEPPIYMEGDVFNDAPVLPEECDDFTDAMLAAYFRDFPPTPYDIIDD